MANLSLIPVAMAKYFDGIPDSSFSYLFNLSGYSLYLPYLQIMSRIQPLHTICTVSDFDPSHQHFSIQELEGFCENVLKYVRPLFGSELPNGLPTSLTKSQKPYNGLQQCCSMAYGPVSVCRLSQVHEEIKTLRQNVNQLCH